MALAASFFPDAYWPEPNVMLMYGHVSWDGAASIKANSVSGLVGAAGDETYSEWLPRSLTIERSDVGVYILTAPSPQYMTPGILLVTPHSSGAGNTLVGVEIMSHINTTGLTFRRIVFRDKTDTEVDVAGFDFVWMLPTSGALRGMVNIFPAA